MRRGNLAASILSGLLFLLPGCSSNQGRPAKPDHQDNQVHQAPPAVPAQAIKDWTFLVYIAGDEESLHEPIIDGLKRLEQLPGLSAEGPINVVVQLDDSGDDPNYRYALRTPLQPGAGARLDTPPIPEEIVRRHEPGFRYGERDSGNPSTLKRFLSWAVQAYPARHYMLLLNGHSWGLQGQMQDFYFAGKSQLPSSIIKNYELRRLLEEVYREQRVHIPEGRFDALHIDGCISGQLDVALELKDVFRYFVAHSIDTPYHGLAFERVLGPFMDALRAAPNRDDASAHKLCEEQLLAPLVREYVLQYAPDGIMTKKEQELSALAPFALRTAELPRVATSLRELVAELEESGIGTAFRNGQRSDLEALRDVDDHVDLLQLAQTLKSEFSARLAATHDPRWQRAIDKAQALTGSLGYGPQDRTSLPTRIRHATAQGAWVHIQVDGFSTNAEMLSCELLRTFRVQNQQTPQHIPALIDGEAHAMPINNLDCEKLAELAPEITATALSPGKPLPLDHVYRLKARWPSGIAAQLFETVGDAVPRQRTLSIWIDRGSQQKLDVELMLQLPGTREIVIEYLSGTSTATADPLGYLRKRPGSAARRVGRETQSVPSYAINTDPQLFARQGGAGLYVAEAHTNGVYHKHGLGIFMRRDFPAPIYRYQRGRIPIERVEKTPYALRLEEYLNSIPEQIAGQSLPLPGVECYRAHRIHETRWDEFLFGSP